jgi:two-component system CheB/CheR fusion protein
MRIKLRAAVQRAMQEDHRVVVPGGKLADGETGTTFSIAVQPVTSDGEKLLLICFTDDPRPAVSDGAASKGNATQIAALEQELAVTRIDLEAAIRNLEQSNAEQKAINEEALSVNEEFQSTNEELLTSKEELQSLNEELTALNGQLQETLERQRTTANDLQNVLYSTDVATIFLDDQLNIRFFTPATKALFNVIPGDVGRPLADLSSLAVDSALLADARQVLQKLTPIEREIEARSGAWYMRRILPYRTQENGVEGVVITFADITELRRASDALLAAKRQAELATMAKSRFLAAASHDLRQPLQTLTLLQGLLAKTVEGESAQKLVTRFDETLSAMSGMLNTLLDINQIEAGTIHTDMVSFPINDLLGRLRDEFTYHAQSPRLSLRVMPCGLLVQSDPRLLEQMLRNLLSNALKYTSSGKVLLGCRRHQGKLRIEVWDTGMGIPQSELTNIFQEYHQLDNTARERGRGLGLGLSIVQRLGELLHHRVEVRSIPAKGSVFTIDVPLAASGIALPQRRHLPGIATATLATGQRLGSILVIEDDTELRELLYLLLKDEGHQVTTVADGVIALETMTKSSFRPDIILADYNLPNGINGVDVVGKLREQLHRDLPAIVLTGDISTETLRDIARQKCVQLYKPVKLAELKQVLQRLLPTSLTTNQAAPTPATTQSVAASPPVATSADAPSGAQDTRKATIFVVDDDDQLRQALRSVLADDGRDVEDFASCEAFLEAYHPSREGCLLVDAYLPGMKGVELLQRLQEKGYPLPAIMITGQSDVGMAVQAMKAGAADFIEKPISRGELLAGIDRALEQARDSSKLSAWQDSAASHLAALTSRQLQILQMVLAGHPSKNIAADLGISQRTVENHRAATMKKTGSKSLPGLARLALAAALSADNPILLPPESTGR